MILLVGGQKGGAGKTNLATNLSAYLSSKGFDLIIIDTDSKQNSSAKWASRRRSQKDLSSIQCVLAHDDIRDTVKDLSNRYQVVIVDAGGRDSKEFRTALAVADICLTPFVPSQHDVDTLPLVDDLIEQIKVYNPNLKGFAIFSNCPQNRSAREKRVQEYRDILQEELSQLQLMNAYIVNRIAYTDTASSGRGVTEMNDAKASYEIKALAKELLNVEITNEEPTTERNTKRGTGSASRSGEQLETESS